MAPGVGHARACRARSGRHYRTPLLVFETRDGFAILIGYGLETDWLKNVLAGGPTVLHKRGKAIRLSDPEMVSKEAAEPLVSPRYRPFYRLFPYNEATLILTRAEPEG